MERILIRAGVAPWAEYNALDVITDKIIGNTPNAIMVLNEDLIVEQINKAALTMFKLRSADDILPGWWPLRTVGWTLSLT